ncbi:hypothetical protein GRAN_4613 [Granulicella sibirica]|uniref:Uncharacterized protein n=1 Tax=Granulicella sibirica TaxID=2479048 RepID=A0A4Q0SUD3_9BACT|nr:hypothetical protein GRAN_4613 [Granulicella sibirica]
MGCSGLVLSGQTTTPSAKVDAGGSTAEVLQSLRKTIDSGHPQDALTQIAELRTKQPAPHGLSRMEGLAQYALGHLQAADAAFGIALKEDGTDVESTQMRGMTLFRLGRPADAIPLLEASRTMNSGTKADPNYVLALCYIDARRYDDARRAFAMQYGFTPDGAPAYLLAARMLLRREYLPLAQGFAKKALDLQPSLPLAHALLGEIALAGNHLDEAIAEFEKERTSNPLEGSVYDRLGDAYSRAARYEEAQHSLQEALLLEPNATGPYILLGKTMLKRGDALGAATYLEHAVQMDPGNYISHSLLGQAYRTMGRKDDASRETATAQRLQSASEPKIENAN